MKKGDASEELADHGPVEGVVHVQQPKHPTTSLMQQFSFTVKRLYQHMCVDLERVLLLGACTNRASSWLARSVLYRYAETLAHHLKGNIVAGIFALGDAFKNGGLFFSPILLLLLGSICVFNQHTLLRCAKVMRMRNKLNYYPDFDDTVEMSFNAGPPLTRSFAKTSRAAVTFFLITVQLGFCCVYIVFVSSTTRQILNHFGYDVEMRINMVYTLVVLLAFLLIRNLKYLAPVSVVAMMAMIVGIGLTLYMSSHSLPSISSRRAFGHLSAIPLCFGTIMFAYEGISLVLPLQNEMKYPEKFTSPLGVLNVGNIVITVLLLLMGFIGYLSYGENVKGSLTLNLPEDNVLSQAVKVAVAVGVLLTYPIMLYVPVVLLWPALVRKWGPFDKPVIYEYILRISLCLLTFVLAELIPNLGVFISLVGAVCSTTLALVFPPLCDLTVRWYDNDYGPFYWRKLMDYLTLAVAAFGFCTGTYFSVLEIVNSFGKIAE